MILNIARVCNVSRTCSQLAVAYYVVFYSNPSRYEMPEVTYSAAKALNGAMRAVDNPKDLL